MRMENLLPRPLDPLGGPESPSIMTALLSGIHLDRRQAHALGWRGVRPSALHGAAWTCRTASVPHIYGLVFMDEYVWEQQICGMFGFYVFPAAEDPLLDNFPLQALAVALGPDYGVAVRELSAHAETLAPFCLGQVRLAAALDGSSLALELSAQARHRAFSPKGIAVPASDKADSAPEDGQKTQWIVAPGELEYDLPAFRLLLRPFAALAGTAAVLLDDAPRLAMRVTPNPLEHLHCGKVEPSWQMRLEAAFGAEQGDEISIERNAGKAVFSVRGKILSNLPGRYVPREDELVRLPVMHVLTGFLGAGKTTFLRRWLDFLNGCEQFAAVIQNEFGAIGLDATLTRGETRVELLDEGCVCCSLADSLRPGLRRLLDAAPADQVILETTGVANPANVLDSLGQLADMVRPGLVITVVDVLEWQGGVCAGDGPQGLRRVQVEQADVIIANKADIVRAEELHAVMDVLRTCNAEAIILPAVQGNITFARLNSFLEGWLDRGVRPPSRRPRLTFLPQGQCTHTDEGFASYTVPLSQPVDVNTLREMILAAGPGLCRAKGIVNLFRESRMTPMVVQYAAGRLEFEEAPDGEHEMYMVFIGVNLRTPDSPAIENRESLSVTEDA